jgi:hypothetical protein
MGWFQRGGEADGTISGWSRHSAMGACLRYGIDVYGGISGCRCHSFLGSGVPPIKTQIRINTDGHPQRTPNGLRRHASELAGLLFSILVETGETLQQATDLRVEDIFSDPPPPDPKIVRLVSDRGIDKQINEVFVYAEDLGLLSGMSAEVPRCTSLNLI